MKSYRGTLKMRVLASLAVLAVIATIIQSQTDKPNNLEIIEQVKTGLASEEIQTSDTKFGLWWISKDGYSITIDNSPAVESKYFNCEADIDERKFWTENAIQQSKVVDAIMQQAGFEVNELNSSDSLEDLQFVDYIRAYERDKTKAVLVVNSDCWSVGSVDSPLYYSTSFSITDDFDLNYEAQSPYLIDLNLKDVIIHVSNVVDNWAVINVNYRRSGHYVIAEEVNGRWVERFGGQDVVPCTLRDELQIPIELVPDCWS
ncbi:MAG: hypothetical protein K9F97_00605 [Candidatus Nanopelagicales bacterium]|nr:hypothetical protein [Candidatus Nanopelagicales bacterium]